MTACEPDIGISNIIDESKHICTITLLHSQQYELYVVIEEGNICRSSLKLDDVICGVCCHTYLCLVVESPSASDIGCNVS